jgi:hypothetical protein
MLKNILNLDGAQQLSNNEQKSINGGITIACNNAIQGGSCYWKTAGVACLPGFTTNSGACKMANVCCELGL